MSAKKTFTYSRNCLGSGSRPVVGWGSGWLAADQMESLRRRPPTLPLYHNLSGTRGSICSHKLITPTRDCGINSLKFLPFKVFTFLQLMKLNVQFVFTTKSYQQLLHIYFHFCFCFFAHFKALGTISFPKLIIFNWVLHFYLSLLSLWQQLNATNCTNCLNHWVFRLFFVSEYFLFYDLLQDAM